MDIKIVGIQILVLLLGVQATAQNKIRMNCLRDQSEIVYSMHHPLHDWQGKSTEINAILVTDEAKSAIFQVAVSVKLSSFDSKNANRDSHMMEVTEALKYPNVTFASNSVTVEGSEFTSSGNLTFHGITQPVALKGKLERNGDKVIFTGKFSVKLSSFKIDPPSLMGISTEDDVNLEFKALFQ